MNAIDKKRAKLYAIGQEIQEAHRSRACGRRGCDCLKRYERTRQQYLMLMDDYEDQSKRGSDRRRGRQ